MAAGRGRWRSISPTRYRRKRGPSGSPPRASTPSSTASASWCRAARTASSASTPKARSNCFAGPPWPVSGASCRFRRSASAHRRPTGANPLICAASAWPTRACSRSISTPPSSAPRSSMARAARAPRSSPRWPACRSSRCRASAGSACSRSTSSSSPNRSSRCSNAPARPVASTKWRAAPRSATGPCWLPTGTPRGSATQSGCPCRCSPCRRRLAWPSGCLSGCCRATPSACWRRATRPRAMPRRCCSAARRRSSKKASRSRRRSRRSRFAS